MLNYGPYSGAAKVGIIPRLTKGIDDSLRCTGVTYFSLQSAQSIIPAFGNALSPPWNSNETREARYSE